MISFELQPYDEENDDFLFDLYASTRAEELEAWGWTDQQREVFLRQQYKAQRQSYHLQFEDADHQIIVAAGKPIGRMMVSRGEDEYRLVDISLLPPYRGSGIGTQILRDLLREAFDAQKPVRLSVVKINPAARLYARLGFVVTDDDGLYLQMTADPRHG